MGNKMACPCVCVCVSAVLPTDDRSMSNSILVFPIQIIRLAGQLTTYNSLVIRWSRWPFEWSHGTFRSFSFAFSFLYIWHFSTQIYKYVCVGYVFACHFIYICDALLLSLVVVLFLAFANMVFLFIVYGMQIVKWCDKMTGEPQAIRTLYHGANL